MNDRKTLFHAKPVGLVLSAALLFTLAGCVTYVDRPPQGHVYVAPPVETVFVVQDDYVYYPSYQVYYSSSRRQYAYQDGRNWISRPAPRGVSVNVLLASPSVRMEFHDSPAQHHATVVKQYPKNWAPPHSNQGQHRNDNDHDQRGANHGK